MTFNGARASALAGQPRRVGSNSIFRRLAVSSAVVGLSAVCAASQTPPPSPTCPGSERTAGPAGNPHDAGVSCEYVDDFTINLLDGTRIETADGPGIRLSGTGQLAIRSAPEARTSITTTGPADMSDTHYGILVQPSDITHPESVSISVHDVSTSGEGATGIYVGTLFGSKVSVTSTGTIAVSGQIADGVRVENLAQFGSMDESRQPSTSIRVHDVVSTASAGPDIEDIGGVVAIVSGSLNIASTGRIVTTTDNNAGIWVVRSGTNSPSAGPVAITVNDIETRGVNSYGIRAALPTSRNSDIRIVVEGDVSTSGLNADGIRISGHHADAAVTVAQGGSIHASRAYGVNIRAADDTQIARSVIFNRGTITGRIYAEGCRTAEIQNTGLFIPVGTTELVKEASCVDRNSETAPAKSNGRFLNGGAVSPWGEGLIGTGKLKADFVQFDAGRLAIDVDWSKETADSLNIEGAASIAGTINVNGFALPFLSSDDPVRVGILSSTGTLSYSAEPVGMVDTIIVDYGIEKTVRTTETRPTHHLALTAALDLEPDELNLNQTNVLGAVAESRVASEDLLSVFIEYLGETDAEAFRNSLDRFGNEIAVAAAQTGLVAAADAIMSGRRCGAASNADSTEAGGSGLGLCTWAARDRGSLISPAMQSQIGFDGISSGKSAGASLGWSGFPLQLDFSVAEDRHAAAMPNIANASGRTVRRSAGVSIASGIARLSIAKSTGRGDHELTRHLPAEAGTDIESSAMFGSRDEATFAAAALDIPLGPWRISPSVGKGSAAYTRNAYRESGAGDYSLAVGSSRQKSGFSAFSVEISRTFQLGGGVALSPRIAVSQTRMDELTSRAESEFGDGLASFSARRTMPGSSRGVHFGAQFASGSGDLFVRAGVSRYKSANSHSRKSASVEIGYRF